MMACRKMKQITMTVFDQEHCRREWFFDFDGEAFHAFLYYPDQGDEKTGYNTYSAA